MKLIKRLVCLAAPFLIAGSCTQTPKQVSGYQKIRPAGTQTAGQFYTTQEFDSRHIGKIDHIVRLPWRNPVIELVADARNWQTACERDSVLSFKVDGKAMPYDKADSTLYHQASEQKLMLLVLTGHLLEKGVISLTDDVPVTDENIRFYGYVGQPGGATNIFVKGDKTKKLGWLLQETLRKSSNQGADLIGEYYGKMILSAGIRLDDNKPYAEQRAALDVMRELGKKLQLSPNGNMVNFSGEKADIISYANAESGTRRPKVNKHGDNALGALDTCRIMRELHTRYPELTSYIRDHSQQAGVTQGSLHAKTGTLTFDAAVNNAAGVWAYKDKRLMVEIAAPCTTFKDANFGTGCRPIAGKRRFELMGQVIALASEQLEPSLPGKKAATQLASNNP